MSFACAANCEQFSVEETLAMLEPSDRGWVLAFALIGSLADDLAVYRRMGLWKTHPDEMVQSPRFYSVPANQPNIMPPNALLKELRSRSLQNCFDEVFSGSCGAIRLNVGAVIRLAKKS
jgi:hypothetical protein